MKPNREVSIAGGGLVGTLLAIFLVRRGLRVTVWERRLDPRGAGESGGRSINLVATTRGMQALGRVGLDKLVERLTVAVTGRMIHSADCELTFQPYGRDVSEFNHSVSRGALNRLLIVEAERRGVQFRFGMRLAGGDVRAGRWTFVDESTGQSLETEQSVLFGADGAGSAARAALAKLGGAYVESVEPLGHGYKELLLPAAEQGRYRIEKNALHLWPRGQIMLMALPNLDGSFTVTLYLPEEGPSSFRGLDTPQKVRELFGREFPDAIPLIPDLAESFFANPTGELGTVRFCPWHFAGRVALIGDAAHAIVPFFGQGMNCGFEDCAVLDALLDEHGENDWATVFEAFTRARKPHADAIADMALENFVEMRDQVADPGFLLRKAVEHRLERDWPLEYRSRYSMVMYGGVPYRVAQQAGEIEREILDELCAGLATADRLDVARARRLIRDRLTPFLARHSVDLGYGRIPGNGTCPGPAR